ncbi:LysR family transcriptional regulator [Massilia sp. LC238]|uniref:LysR family transcriptional regulator n=1 Tax=Massilia sp. LC238 TaxID=1502852 RepID=UPI0004E3A208|nr:LysR family transcriptional regulator [Massilia sp. LC238]KFC74977.1 putative transcription regulator protein, LysR [Massilia sp. LC238]
MDRFAELKAFCLVAASGGFSPAARQMGVATSSVTRLVDALEARLGAVLLNRSTRSVTLTDTGRSYYEEARRVLEQLDAADDAVAGQGGDVKGVLRVAAPASFATLHIAPILPELRARYPRLVLDLRLSDEAARLVDESIDVAIRIGRIDPDSTLVARRLGSHRRLLCASPAYLASRGTPILPADLAHHDCLQLAERRVWRMRRLEREGEAEEISIDAVLQANSAELLRQAALAGLGVAMLAHWLVRDDVAAGRLAPVLPAWEVNPGPMDVTLHALYQPNRRGSHKIRAFVDLLAAHLTRSGLN